MEIYVQTSAGSFIFTARYTNINDLPTQFSQFRLFNDPSKLDTRPFERSEIDFVQRYSFLKVFGIELSVAGKTTHKPTRVPNKNQQRNVGSHIHS